MTTIKEKYIKDDLIASRDALEVSEMLWNYLKYRLNYTSENGVIIRKNNMEFYNEKKFNNNLLYAI